MFKFIGLLIIFLSLEFCSVSKNNPIITGAQQPGKYLPLLKNKRVGLVVNNTSVVEDIHLVDFLLSKNIRIEKIFAPEHGFRGDASAGAKIKDGVDSKTGIKVFSLYGKTRKPTPEHLKNLDVIVFDIQDVGSRYYTFIYTMAHVMIACERDGKKIVVLDRPNPINGVTIVAG